ncbi:MAG: GNAT family N-acetyltransferase [Caldilineaceae bacterium]|nr:GNAT family N-acetyltransferase [Caldilineaceae bacterium]
MTAINAATGHVQHVDYGIRAFDIGQDLRPVAELIADAFTNELDQRGQAALREMRIMSHISGLLKLLNRSTGEFDDVFSGFVWVEDGHVIGNVTVQRGDQYGNRWQIANVAVAPAYRGRGIARRLMERALEHVRASHGRWAVLQVYTQNDVARRLYERLGFEDIVGTTSLRLDRAPQAAPFPTPMPNFRSFASGNWQPLYELAINQHNDHAQWWRPIRRSEFQTPVEQQFGEWLWRSMGRRTVYRRCIQSARRFEAALILTAQKWREDHEVELWVRPQNYGQYEEQMVQWILATLNEYPRWPVSVKLSTHHEAGLNAFRAHGFQSLTTLMTMRYQIAE